MSDDGVLEGGVHTVRRVGDTVVRPTGPYTETVHRLLRHLRSVGFNRAPEALAHEPGRGAEPGRETLSFVAGETTGYPLSPAFRTDAALVGAARLLRDYHDATVGFQLRPGVDRWFLPPRKADPTGEPWDEPVICHGDFAPYNCVITGGIVTGLFDFDTAHPGPRLWDLGYAAYRWVPLTAPDSIDGTDGFGDGAEQARRLRLFRDAYRNDEIETPTTLILASASERLTVLVETMRTLAAGGDPAFRSHVEAGHDRLYLRDAAYIDQAEALRI